VLFGVWVSVVLVVGLALVLFLVLPTRTWFSQRSVADETERRLAAVQQENAALEARVRALQDPAEVERLARQTYNMVRPGEQPLSILPPAPLAQLPGTWPYTVVQGILAARQAASGGPPAPSATTTPG
jgi:cell division protein FtsB